MADVHSKSIRSYNMSQIRSKDTKPELIIRRFLHSQGYRFRLHDKSLPGKPDLVLKKLKTAIFVHGCFWHGHKDCKYFVVPKTQTQWWLDKINANKKNDRTKKLSLEKSGWNTITIWECEIKPAKQEKTLNKLLKILSTLSK
ncbi:MAG: DNA mismatch endonuclease Vsr [Saprospiraceae bacterium]|nr:DNA mismatch endonuclease Vsr [Saprospiraceae bacterium]